jgi:hypothetical protein
LHAQVQSAAELQAWVRVDDVRATDVGEALWSQRTLVRSWAQRGTLHLHTAGDWPVYASALELKCWYGLTPSEPVAVVAGAPDYGWPRSKGRGSTPR